MARIQTFDHCGFMVEDVPRSEQFYKKLFGATFHHISNLNTRRLYDGWPVISFLEMGGHRFELCLAQQPLPHTAGTPYPRIGFLLSDDAMRQLLVDLHDVGVAYEGPLSLPAPIPLASLVRVCDPDGNVIEFTTRRTGRATSAQGEIKV